MRLIDADEFAIEEPELWDWSSVDGISSTAVLKQCIWDVQCAPTVKAIPIEWIEKQMVERENYGDFNTAAAIGYLLLEWEKEKSVKISEGNYDSDEEYEEQMRCLNETNRCG